jgi:hypothetical protein
LSASPELLIGDAGGAHVLVRALSRNQPDLFGEADANWIACEVEIVSGGLRAGFRADLRSEEFQAFLDETEALRAGGQGVASFSTMEGQLAISLIADARGHVGVDGDARDAPGSDNRLHFNFEIDQTSLPDVCRSLEVLLAGFPVVGTRNG